MENQTVKSLQCFLFALVLALSVFFTSTWSNAANQTWDGGTSGNGSAWYTVTNWAGDAAFPGSQATTTNTDIASIGSTGTNPNIGINGTTSANLYLGAIDFTSASRAIGDSAAGTVTFTLNGASVNSVSNVILRNSG